MRPLSAVIHAFSTTMVLAQETVRSDRVYVLHSQARRACPVLDWHKLVHTVPRFRKHR
jgi:hypothetical protein